MIWPAPPMTWILIGVVACVLLGLGCVVWASEFKPLSENPHHDEY